MLRKNRKKSPAFLSADELADTAGGTRVPAYLTLAQKMKGCTHYSTDGEHLYHQCTKLGKLKDLT